MPPYKAKSFEKRSDNSFIPQTGLINGELPVPFGEVKQDCYIECPSLKSMKNAPKKIKGQLTFYNCPNLEKITIYSRDSQFKLNN